MELKKEYSITCQTIIESLVNNDNDIKEEINFLTVNYSEDNIIYTIKDINKEFNRLGYSTNKEYSKAYEQLKRILKDIREVKNNNLWIDEYNNINQVTINGLLTRVDNILKDQVGYYYNEVCNKDLWNIKYNKVYLNDMQSKLYLKIENYNIKYREYLFQIELAKLNNRVIKTKQKVSNDILNVLSLTYYDLEGNQVRSPNKVNIQTNIS